MTDHQNVSNQFDCITDDAELFNGFTEEEKCFDRHEDTEYLQQCRYYIEVNWQLKISF